VWFDVDDRLDGECEPMMQRVLDFVCGFVALIHGQFGVDGNRHGNAQLVTVPSLMRYLATNSLPSVPMTPAAMTQGM
jgi:hypothetical protein